MNKKVSVIIPNYNYARFLQRRIDCIVNQTIKPAEIIFLDDCSTDNSLEVAQEILSKTDVPYRIIPNEVNQGVFKQWLKGIELTQYDYFWIAEADDYCELNFLEILLPAFDDEDVVMSYCQSKIVDQDGCFIANEFDYKAKYFDPSRWHNCFVNNGLNEVKDYLSLQNTIPNASALLINKRLLDLQKILKSTEYKMCGDWMFYIQALLSKNNKISYNSTILNNFVRHENSVFGQAETLLVLNYELSSVFLFVAKESVISDVHKGVIFKESLNNFFWFPSNELILDNIMELSIQLGIKLDLLKVKNDVYNDIRNYSTSMERQLENNKQILMEKLNLIYTLELDVDNNKFKIEECKHELEECKHELSLTKSSVSYKVTKPLRIFKMLILKLKYFLTKI